MYNPSSPVTGGAQTGLTTPGYTLTLDRAPDVNGTQHAVTGKSGTQTNVRLHTISDPFTATFFTPKAPKALPSANPVTGRYPSVPYNGYSFIVRKGVNFAPNQAPKPMVVRVFVEVPAGADAYDADNVRAAMSLVVGILSQQSSGIGDTIVTGVP